MRGPILDLVYPTRAAVSAGIADRRPVSGSRDSAHPALSPRFLRRPFPGPAQSLSLRKSVGPSRFNIRWIGPLSQLLMHEIVEYGSAELQNQSPGWTTRHFA